MRGNRNQALAIPLWRGQGEDFERKEHKVMFSWRLCDFASLRQKIFLVNPPPAPSKGG